MRALWIALALGGCVTDPPPKIVVDAPVEIHQPQLKDTIPRAAMQCAAEPDGSKVESTRQVAEYVVDLRSAGQDCRRKLGTLRSLVLSEER